MDRKRPRKDISNISKRHLNRLVKEESELICKSVLNMTAIPSHKNINDKRTNNIENISEVKFDMTNIEGDERVIEKNNEWDQRNDMLMNYEDFSSNEYQNKHNLNSLQCIATIPCDESKTHVTSESENAHLANNDFEKDLAVWATEYQIPHNALKALLQKLRQHSCFSTLLADPRSLLKTPRTQTIRVVEPGIYYHFGLLNCISDALTLQRNIDCVRISINVDGLPLSKSSQQQFWPILGLIIPYNNVFTIGLYYGNEKPADANNFLQEFVDEATEICENGIYINNRHIQCRIEALICDAPAKSFVLHVKGHSGYSSCTKCINEGEYIRNWICFPQTDAPLRTDENFLQKVDDNYHDPDVTCSLLRIPHFQPVTNVPLDPMHLLYLGIMRKLIYLWLSGDLHYRVPHRAVKEISTRLLTQLKPSIPSEFARKPRGMDCVKL